MPTLPTSVSFTGAGVTEAQFKTAITDQREFLAGLLGTAGTQAAALTALGAQLNAVAAKTAAYSVVVGDRGKLIDYTTGTFTLTLLAAATATAGFAFAVRNSGTGVITIDPSASELIDGVATVTLNAGESCLVVCNGTAWKTVGKSANAVVDTQTFTTVGAATWTKPAKGSIAVIEVWGAGGGGGRGASTGGGGGGGGYIRVIKKLSDLGATETVTVGAGGAGATTANTSGGHGSDTTFGAHATGRGGKRGRYSENVFDFPYAYGGSGGFCALDEQDNNLTLAPSIPPGMGGTKDYPRAARGYCEGGGGGAGYAGGVGGNSIFGGGGGGGGYSSSVAIGGGTSIYGGAGGTGGDSSPLPTSGTAPGGGGGGAYGAIAGAGAAGKCVVTVF